MFNVFRILFLLSVGTVVIFSCSTESDPGTNDFDPEAMVYDHVSKMILYNGNAFKINDGIFPVNDDTLVIQTSDDMMMLGVEYNAIYQNEEVRIYLTELPIVVVIPDTHIPNEPKVSGRIRILERGKEPFEHDIAIEIRGGISRSFPKKSYGFELRNENDASVGEKVSLLGLRQDDDWILDGMWNEPLRIRDFTAQSIWQKFGRVQTMGEHGKVGIGLRYCEFFLWSGYHGVYYLGERMDRKQLGLEKYAGRPEGELFKSFTWTDAVLFRDAPPINNQERSWFGFEVKYPTEKGQWDWNSFHALIDFVVNGEKRDFDNQIFTKIDIHNAIDYFIFLNFSMAIDNSGKNMFYGRINSYSPYFMIPWDLDGSFANHPSTSERLNYSNRILRNGLFRRLLKNDRFKQLLVERWVELRSDELSYEHVVEEFRKNYDYLFRNGVYLRESTISIPQRIDQNYDETEMNFIENWIRIRLDYLDTYFAQLQ